MTFRGARVEGGEYFDDILGADAGGIYDGHGLDDYEGMHETVTPQGVRIRMNCRKCGQQHDVTLDWKELYLVGSNGPGKALLKPRGWEYSPNNGSLYPATVLCSKCRDPLCPQVTPDEAQSRVRDAISRNLIPMGEAQLWQNEVAAWRQANG